MSKLQLSTPISCWSGVHAGRAMHYVGRLSSVLTRVRMGNRGLSKEIKRLRELYRTDRARYKKEKESLPVFTPAGEFQTRKIIKAHSQLLHFDFDLDDQSDARELQAELAYNPSIALSFISPSGAGVKGALLAAPTMPVTGKNHYLAYHALTEFMSQYGEIDPQCKDVTRLCFFSYDPNIYVNENPDYFNWEEWVDEDEVRGAYQQEKAKQRYQTGDVDITALDYVDADDYKAWIHVGMACHRAGVDISVWRSWSEKSEKYREGDCEKHWYSFTSDPNRENQISWGSVIHLAKANGYTPPRRYSKPVQLQKNSVLELVETWQKMGDAVGQILRNAGKFFALRGDTGIGKNHQSEVYCLDEGIVTQIVPSTELAIDTENRMTQRELRVVRHRGVLTGWSGNGYEGSFPNEIVCVHGPRRDRFAQKGGNPMLICDTCEMRAQCEDEGYLSFPKKAQDSEAVIVPLPEAYLNPKFHGFAKKYLPRGAKGLILHDDVDSAVGFIECSITKYQLHLLMHEWADTDCGTFAEWLLQALEVKQDIYSFKEKIEGLTPQDRKTIIHGLTHCRVWVVDAHGKGSVQSFTIEDAVKYGFYSIATLEGIETIRPVQKQDWNILTQLETFFERYPRAEDAPIKYENETLTFMLPAMPLKTEKRIGFMGASLDEVLFKRGLPQTEFYNQPSVKWHEGAELYQLRTNRNPRSTVLNDDGTLTNSGQLYWDMMLTEIDKTPDTKHAIITYQCLLDTEFDVIIRDNVVATAHFGNLKGLDTTFEDAEVLWILFSPELPPTEIEWRASFYYGDDAEPLLRDAEGNLTRDKNGYTDKRVQRVWANGVIQELIQAVGRARLVRYPKRVVLFCSHHLPNITTRRQTILFDENDWDNADELQNLKAAVQTREQKEGEIIDAINKGESERSISKRFGITTWYVRTLKSIVTRARLYSTYVLDSRAGHNCAEYTLNLPKGIREQILELLSSNLEMRTGEIVEQVNGSRRKIMDALKKLVEQGKVLKVKHGVYKSAE